MKFVTKVKDQATSAFLSTLMLTGLGLSVPAAAVADEAAAGLQFIIVSDDLRKTTTDTERTDAGADGSMLNNGHGNNEDGVDMSNPGEGDGGPNGAEDSDPEVDDEAGGGGASPSNTNKGQSKK